MSPDILWFVLALLVMAIPLAFGIW